MSDAQFRGLANDLTLCLEKRNGALKNCLLLAMREYHKTKNENWKHIIRFCEEAGIKPTILRKKKAEKAND